MTKFHGFREADLSQLKDFSSGFGVEIATREMATAGRSWGEAVLQGPLLAFQSGGKTCFEIDTSEASDVKQTGKNDVAIEFADDDAAEKQDQLVEIVFHVPLSNKEHAPAEGADEEVTACLDHGPRGRLTTDCCG